MADDANGPVAKGKLCDFCKRPLRKNPNCALCKFSAVQTKCFDAVIKSEKTGDRKLRMCRRCEPVQSYSAARSADKITITESTEKGDGEKLVVHNENEILKLRMSLLQKIIAQQETVNVLQKQRIKYLENCLKPEKGNLNESTESKRALTYNTTLETSKYKLIVKSASFTTCKEIKSTIDTTSASIERIKIMPLKNRSVIMPLKDRSVIVNDSQNLDVVKSNTSEKIPRPVNPQIIIFNVCMDDLSDPERFVVKVFLQNKLEKLPTSVFRIVRLVHRSSSVNVIVETDPVIFKSITKSGYLYVGWRKYYARSLTRRKPLKMHKIKSPPQIVVTKQSKTSTDSDDNNNNATHHHANNFKTYRLPKNRTVRVSLLDKMNTNAKVTQPCKTCGRADQPERFHSHPEAPIVPVKKTSSQRIPVMKNSVQKPVAIKYHSKLAEKRKPTSPKKIARIPDEKKNETVAPKRVGSAKGPRTLTCYICGREFGTMSLPLHEPKCLEKWERENASLPPNLQRKRPVKPEGVLTKNEWNTHAWEASQANLVPCQHCGRTFYPDRLVVHQRSCKPKAPASMAKLPQEESVDTPRASVQKPRTVACGICGKLFGTTSIKIHEPQCLKKWHLQNDHLPPNERQQMFRDIGVDTEAPPVAPTTSPPQSEETENKSPMFPCYLCGRLFSVTSIYIHEPQCLKKWKVENDKLPPSKRRPTPLKPDVKFTPDGQIDHHATGEANWLSHLQQLVPCKRCGRTFYPDRVEVHERLCKRDVCWRMNDIIQVEM